MANPTVIIDEPSRKESFPKWPAREDKGVEGTIRAAKRESPYPRAKKLAFLQIFLALPERSSLITFIIICFLMLVIIVGCSSEDNTSTTSTECPNILGTWRSEQYQALSVLADGAHETLSNLTMSAEIGHQEGCLFRGTHTWSNSEIEGTEHLSGVLNSDGSRITMIEVGEHPEGGTTGQISGELIGQNQMNWEYVGLANDGSRGTVFKVLLTRTD